MIFLSCAAIVAQAVSATSYPLTVAPALRAGGDIQRDLVIEMRGVRLGPNQGRLLFYISDARHPERSVYLGARAILADPLRGGPGPLRAFVPATPDALKILRDSASPTIRLVPSEGLGAVTASAIEIR